MFLNNLCNRLQPHAKPILQVANILSSVIITPQPSCSFTILDQPVVDTTLADEQLAVQLDVNRNNSG